MKIEVRERLADITLRLLAVALIACFGVIGFLSMRHGLYNLPAMLILALLIAIIIFLVFGALLGMFKLRRTGTDDTLLFKLFEQLQGAVVVTDRRGSVVLANKTYSSLSDSASPVGPQALFTYEKQLSQLLYRAVMTIKNGQSFSEIIRPLPQTIADRLKLDSESCYLQVCLDNLDKPKMGKLLWQFTIGHNVQTDQHHFFHNLQETINHLDRAPVGFFSYDTEGQLAYVNATLADWVGLDIGGFKFGDHTISQLFAETDNRDMLFKQNVDEPFVFHLKTTNGVMPVWVFVSWQGEKNETEHAVGIGRAVIVPEYLLKQTAFEAISDTSTDDIAAFCETIPVALAGVRLDGTIHFSNQAFRKLVNMSENSRNSSECLDHYLIDKERSLLKNAIQRVQDKQSAEPLDVGIAGEGDKHIRLHFSGLKRSPDATEVFIFITAIETTEQKIFEQQMAQNQKMQAVGQLAGGIAHDFNNVLTAIIMSCDLLLSSHRSSDPAYSDLINIKNNANRAASLVQQLLAFSRRQTLRPVKLDLTDILSDIRTLVSHLLGNKIKLVITHGRDLWPIEADQESLQRVIMNLCINARDAMPDGGSITISTKNISTEAARGFEYDGFVPDNYVMLSIADTGTGISEEVQAKMFEPFFTTKEVGKGTGLGLSMVYGIIKQSGGHVYCDSELGKGTTFRIFLPRFVAKEQSAVELLPKESAMVEEQNKKSADLSGSATVLMVEDEDAVRMGGVRALKTRGYTVLEASTGLEALEVLQEYEGKIDIVVSDVVMPEMDGPTLLREMLKTYPDIKFMFVSGFAKDAFAKNLPDDATFGFLAKPFSLKALAEAVKDTLAQD